jgi:acyl-CoA synthetase (AMP-forming)/AMP-acid ligase II
VGHRQLSHNCALIRRQFGIAPSDVEVSWLPQSHDMGLVVGGGGGRQMLTPGRLKPSTPRYTMKVR